MSQGNGHHVTTFPLRDAPCAVCWRPTVCRACVLDTMRDRALRVPCCDSCTATLDDYKRAELVRAAADRELVRQSRKRVESRP